jgi:glycosyltransferase involved in cell wall biosynthesis
MIPHKKKDSLILSVGRFDNLMQSKRHDVLIEAFAKLPKKSKWKLVIAGGVLHGDKVVADLRSKVSGKNIEILSNLGWEDIADLYAKASVYWHAAGYGLDLVENPEKAEHFGISTVEAMSAGAVPVVFDGGGLPEIVTHNTHGYLWKTPQELVTYTLNIIQDDDLRIQLGKAASIRAREFSTEVFEREFKKIIG